MLIAHGPAAVLASYVLQKKEVSKLSQLKLFLFVCFSFFLGIFPDFDIFYLASRGKGPFLHHSLATHTPFFWIVLGLLLYLVMKYSKFPKSNRLQKLVLTTFLISTLSHMFFDLFTGHIMLLSPLSTYYFTLLGNIVPDAMFGGYFSNPVFGLEIILWFLFAIYFVKSFFKINLKYLIILPLLYLVFNIFMYTQTYHIDIYKKENGSPIFDTDKDGLADSADYDFDNNFVSNFDQVSKDELLTKFEVIQGRTNFLPSTNLTTFNKLKYLYGGHTILRGLTQAYAQTGNYLPPVVHDYMRRHDIKTFSVGLYQFLISTQKFKLYEKLKEVVPGSLVIAEYGKDYTVGIVLRNGNILISDKDGTPMEVASNYPDLLIQD